MGGSASKRPPPSYIEGKVRDPEIERLQSEHADDDQRGGLLQLIRNAVKKPASKS